MAAQSDTGMPMLGDEPAGNRLVPASSPEQRAGKDATKERSAKLDVDKSWMKQFIRNLLRALSAWPT